MNTRQLLKAVAVAVPAGLIATAAAAFALSVEADQPHSPASPAVATADADEETAPSTRPAGDAYPLDTCPVGGKLGSMGDPIVRTIDGRTVRFCCQGCVGTFEKDREMYHARLDEMIIAAQADGYPLAECLVSGEDLNAMGGLMGHVHRPTNQLVRFCCGSCAAAFRKAPEKYLAKLNTVE